MFLVVMDEAFKYLTLKDNCLPSSVSLAVGLREINDNGQLVSAIHPLSYLFSTQWGLLKNSNSSTQWAKAGNTSYSRQDIHTQHARRKHTQTWGEPAKFYRGHRWSKPEPSHCEVTVISSKGSRCDDLYIVAFD